MKKLNGFPLTDCKFEVFSILKPHEGDTLFLHPQIFDFQLLAKEVICFLDGVGLELGRFGPCRTQLPHLRGQRDQRLWYIKAGLLMEDHSILGDLDEIASLPEEKLDLVNLWANSPTRSIDEGDGGIGCAVDVSPNVEFGEAGAVIRPYTLF